MAKTPKNLTPASRRPDVVTPQPTAQMPPQTAVVLQQVAPVPSVQAAPAPAPEDASSGPSEEELAAIMARRAKAPPAGSLQMQVPARVGWARRWVNDTPGRVQKFINKGWNFVKSPETGENWMLTVNKSITSSGGLRGYVMEIPLQFYAEDQMVKKESLDVLDAAIYGGTHDEEPDDKRYVPKETPIKVDTRTGPGSG